MKKWAMVLALVVLVGWSLPAESADFNGDGTNDIGIFRSSTGKWAVRDVTLAYWGVGAEPVPGDYNGDGTVDIGIFRSSYGKWAVKDVTIAYWGVGADPLPGISAGGGGGGGGYWSKYGNNVYYNSGNVGIGNLYPSSTLSVLKDTNAGTATDPDFGFRIDDSYSQNVALLLAADATNNIGAIQVMDPDDSWITRALVLQPRGGLVGIGTTSPSAKLDVYEDRTGPVAFFVNDGNDSNHTGLAIRCGEDSGSGYLIEFYDGDGTYVGDITFAGGNVNYNSFSGGHDASIPEKDNEAGYPYGTVVSLRATHPNPERPRQVNYDVEPSTKACDQSVFGVYADKRESGKNLHSIYALGDGHILVTGEGGDIEIGDYLTTSSKEGHAMKQGNGVLYNYTVAKAQEDVYWAKEESNSKLIPCTYHAQ